jgi:hypothetical protein
LDKGAEYVAFEYPWESAVGYWVASNLGNMNDLAEKENHEKMGDKINPHMGIVERQNRIKAYYYYIKGKYTIPEN